MSQTPVPLNVDGSATLRAGRFYRMLVVVNGQPGAGELYQAIAALGFGKNLAVTWPGDWAQDKPASWPEEAPPATAANEFLLRGSGSFTGKTRTVRADSPIAGGGTMTIAQLWDCGPVATPATTTRGAVEEDDEPEKKKGGNTGALAIAGILGALFTWKLIGGRHEGQREKERNDYVRERAHRLRRVARVNELLTEGHKRSDAEVLAEYEEHEEHEPRDEHEHAYEGR